MNDLISRKAALDIFKPWLDVKGYSEGELNMLRAVIYELETMSSTSAWISVKDRLPEKDGEYLVRGVVHMLQQELLITRVSSYCSNNSHFGEQDYFTTITHWMSLPEPPKEVEE